MKRIILDKQRGTSYKEQRTLYIYYPGGATQRISPQMDKFNGNWKDLADAVSIKYYIKFEVK